MRSRRSLSRSGIAVAAILASFIAAPPAAAQGLLESLFGVFAPKPQPKVFAPPRREGSQFRGYGGHQNRANPFDSRRSRPAYASGGRYKTMCVRLCDGFYFPISSSARRREFYRDAEQCQAQCDSETRLFYMPRDAGSIEAARDQTGLYYEELRNAFLYRKKLDQSCSCRPQPWSVAERLRHERYALIEAGQVKDGEPLAGGAGAQGDMDQNKLGEGDIGAAEDGTIVEGGQVVAGGNGQDRVGPFEPSQAPVERRYVAAPSPPQPQPAFGLGTLFAGGVVWPSAGKPVKEKFLWPGDDGN
jgi:hypothetical protein